MITVRDLKERLNQIDDEDMPVVCTRYSDVMDQELPVVIDAIYVPGAVWHATASKQIDGVTRKVLYFVGN